MCARSPRPAPAQSKVRANDSRPTSMSRKPTARKSPGRSPQNDRTAERLAPPGLMVTVPGTSAVVIEGVWKFFGDYPALRDISFNVDPGACLALLGRNGAGKTTLLRILAGSAK